MLLGFDGKKSRTLEEHCQTHVQDKQAIIDNVGRRYVSHGIPVDGSGEEVSNLLIKVATTHKSLDTITSASSDGENKNTGEHNGALRLLEVKLQRPITWIVCMSHNVELSLRKVFESLGKNTA